MSGAGDDRAPIVELHGAGRSYLVDGRPIMALAPTTLRVSAGDWVAVLGPSGSGKTTLLSLIAGLDRPTVGSIAINGRDLASMNDVAMAAWRAANVGLVFQDPRLLPGLTAIENVIVARMPFERGSGLAERARQLLWEVGLGDRAGFPPARLSGGERQRVGVARALIGDPSILIADEPTGNLDAAATQALLELISRLRRERSLTVLVATHDPIVASAADRSFNLGASASLP